MPPSSPDPTLPLLSIVTPCRNAARFLPRALESVARAAAEAAEAFAGAIEHIILDGGSTDGSVEIIQAHARQHPELVSYWCSGPDRGQSDAINRGMRLARGRYSAWINADDWYEPGALAPVMERLRTQRDDAVIVGRCRMVDEAGATIFEPVPPDPISLANLLRLRTQWFAGRSLVQPEVFFPLELFRRIGGLNIDNHYSMDHELWCRMAGAGARFERIDRLIASLLIHPGQKTHDNRASVRSILNYAILMAAEHRALLGEHADQVEAELHSIADKLRVADAVIRWWQRALEEPRAPRAALKWDEHPPIPGESETAARRVNAAAARALRWRWRVRIGFFECDPHVVSRTVRAFPLRRLDLHIASLSQLAISQSAAAMRPLLGRNSTITAHHGPLVAGRFDLLVSQAISVRSIAPASEIAGLWSRLAPGGVYVQLDDPYLSPDFRRYIDSLSARLGDYLTHDADVYLHPDVDAVLLARAQQPSPQPFPGIDPHALVPRLSADARLIAAIPFGGPHEHPLSLPVLLGSPDLHQFSAWISSAWRRGM